MGELTEAVAPKKPKVAMWIATGFGLGYLPVAPGTWGSLGGILLTTLPIFLFEVPLPIQFDPGLTMGQIIFVLLRGPWILAITVGLIGVWASSKTASHFGKQDPQQVVIDEVCGQQITFLLVLPNLLMPGGWKYMVLGFVLFRVFDIVKPWPIRRLEKLPGGWGIMADDWLAGVYAAIVLWVVRWQGWIG